MSAPDIHAWEAKLKGKRYIDPEREAEFNAMGVGSDKAFKQGDLPEGTRVVPWRVPITLEYVGERLNVYLDDEGTCIRCNAG